MSDGDSFLGVPLGSINGCWVVSFGYVVFNCMPVEPTVDQPIEVATANVECCRCCCRRLFQISTPIHLSGVRYNARCLVSHRFDVERFVADLSQWVMRIGLAGWYPGDSQLRLKSIAVRTLRKSCARKLSTPAHSMMTSTCQPLP